MGPTLFAIVLSRLDLGALKDAFAKASLAYVGLGLLGSVFVPVLRSVRWNLINRTLGIHMVFVDTVRVQFVGNAAALITPARLGMELYRFLSVRNLGHPSGRVIRGIALDRLYDVLTVGLIFLAGASSLRSGLDAAGTAIFAVLLLGSVVPATYVLSNPDSKFLGQIVARLTPKSLRQMKENVESSEDNTVSAATSLGGVFEFLSFSILVVLANTLRVQFFAWSLGFDIGFMFLLWCVSAIVICNYLPISFMGVGIRDVTLVCLLSTWEVGAEEAVYISTLILTGLVLQALIGAALHLLAGRSTSAAAENVNQYDR